MESIDDPVAWAKTFRAAQGTLPGRKILAKQFNVTDHQARQLSDRIRFALLEPGGEGFRVSPVEPPAGEDVFDGAALWELQAAVSKRAIAKRESTAYRTISFDDDGPVALCFPSDLHLGSAGTDHAKILADQQLIAATPRAYQVNGGDIFDNAIKHKGMTVNSESTPSREIRLLQYLLEVAGHRYLGVVSGNHDDWTVEQVGVDVLAMLFGRAGVAYAPGRLHLTIQVGEQVYRVLVSHKYRYNSSLNPLHAVQRMLERGQDDFDIGAIGHNHEVATGVFYHRRKRRAAIRPGSYQIGSPYSTTHGFNDSVPSCPCVVLRGDRNEFYPFDDLRHALELFAPLRDRLAAPEIQ